MAEVAGPLLIKGSIGGISVYWNSRLKKWIARQKGGANKNLIQNSPAFVRTRENNVEFIACNKFCHRLRLALLELDHLNYGYCMGGDVQMIKNIQMMDQDSLNGHRNIGPSKYKSLLTEINFNKEHPFKQLLLRRTEVTADNKRQSIMGSERASDLLRNYPIIPSTGRKVMGRWHWLRSCKERNLL